jgi:hypothetical protein
MTRNDYQCTLNHNSVNLFPHKAHLQTNGYVKYASSGH